MIKASTLFTGVLVAISMVMITVFIMAIAPYLAGVIVLVVLFRCYFHRSSKAD